MQVPAPPRPDLGEEAAHVGGHRRGRVAGEDVLEVAAREVVLALEKERPRQLQAHPHQAGAVDQQGAEPGDRLVQQGVAVGFRGARPLRGPDRGEAGQEDGVRPGCRVPDQRTQDVERVGEPAAVDQGAGLGEAGRGPRRRRGRCGGRLRGAPGRPRQHEAGGRREGAEERAGVQCHGSQDDRAARPRPFTSSCPDWFRASTCCGIAV